MRRAGRLAAIKTPLLVLLSEKDAIVPSATIEAPLGSVPNLTLITIKGAWHEVMSEKDTFRNDALAHLKAHLKAHLEA